MAPLIDYSQGQGLFGGTGRPPAPTSAPTASGTWGGSAPPSSSGLVAGVASRAGQTPPPSGDLPPSPFGDPLEELPVVTGYDEAGQQTSRTVGELYQRLYQMDPDKLAELQQRLYAGGFYGGKKLAEVRWGNPDDAFTAYRSLITSVLRQQAGDDTPDGIEGVLRRAEEIGLILGAGEGTPRAPVVLSLSDPAAVEQTMDDTARAVLGRGLDADTKRAFIAMIHQMQRSQQTSMQTAEDGSTVETFGVDVDAQAEKFARQQAPEEAFAHDMAGAVGSVINLFGGK